MTTSWFQRKLHPCLCFGLAGLFITAPGLAQDRIDLDSLLFEAYPAGTSIPGMAALSSAAEGRTELSKNPGIPAEPPINDKNTIDLYLADIAATEASAGPFAPVLLEQYLSLGELYQRNDEHADAITVFEKAEYISRINSGLYAAEQFDIGENLIASYTAIGEQRKAADKQQYLLFLSHQNFGQSGAQAVPLLNKLGDWQMAAFASGINADSQFTISIGSSRSLSPAQLAFGNLYRAQNIYFQAINNLIANNQFNNPVLHDLEMKLIETVFLSANRGGLLEDPDFYLDRRPTRTGSRIARRDLSGFSLSYANGRNAYTRMRLYEEHQKDIDVIKVAEAMIGLADWNLLFSHTPNALKLYGEAAAYLRSHNIPKDVIDGILDPEIPEQLPVFTPLPHSREKFGIDTQMPLEFTGYIDITFKLSRFGNASKVTVTGSNGSPDKAVERRLRRLLHTSPFRPRIRDGEAVTSQVDVRYYYADARAVQADSGTN